MVPPQATAQTIGFEKPSVVVTMGEPLPLLAAHHATPNVGGLVGLIRSATRSPGVPGHPTPVPPPLKTTYVPDAVVNAAGALRVCPDATLALNRPSPVVPSPVPIPPRY